VHRLEQVRRRQRLVCGERVGAGEVDVLLGVAGGRVLAAKEDFLWGEGGLAGRVARVR
jgi:hypothetical protein